MIKMIDVADLVKAARARHVVIYGKKSITDVLADTVEAQAAEIARLCAEQDKVRGYLSRLLQSLYPSIEVLPDMLGVCTQIDHVLAGQREEIARLCADLATANTWRDTINSRLTSWMHPVLDGEEPHDALMRLLDFERRAFCDPAVSQDAADLVATARREGMEDAAKIASERRALANQAQALREGAHDKKGAAEAAIEAHEAAEIAAAIRAAAKEGKS